MSQSIDYDNLIQKFEHDLSKIPSANPEVLQRLINIVKQEWNKRILSK